MYPQASNPTVSLALSAALAAVPILVMFALLLSKRVGGHIAAAITLAVSLLVATVAFHMPPLLALLSALFGILNGLFPIGWIVFAAVFLYNLSVRSGSFAVVCRGIESITADRRLQALLIAFCFGAFLEGCAGFGAPVAITAGMLVGLGFKPLYAAGICLFANSAPVAFGSIGIPIVTAAQTSGVDAGELGRMVAHQLPLLSLIVPFYLVVLMAGWRGLKGIWPAVLVTAGSYSLTMFLVATYLGPLLPNIVSAIVSIVCLVLFLRVWKAPIAWRFPSETSAETVAPVVADSAAVPFRDQIRAWTPYLLLILFVGNWGAPGIKALLDRATLKCPIPHLDGVVLSGPRPIAAVYNFNFLSAAGTAILLAALSTALLQRIPLKTIGLSLHETATRLRNPLITIGSVVGFAYVANFSGMTLALGSALTVTGSLFPLLSPIVGWIGVLVSGSDTAANALFSNLQRTTANHLGLNPLLTIAANTDGGVCAKMISPQSIAVAAASSRLVGKEGQMFRSTLPHSLALLGLICVLTLLQAHALAGMVPSTSSAKVNLSAVAKLPAALDPNSVVLLAVSAAVLVSLAVVNASRRYTEKQE